MHLCADKIWRRLAVLLLRPGFYPNTPLLSQLGPSLIWRATQLLKIEIAGWAGRKVACSCILGKDAGSIVILVEVCVYDRAVLTTSFLRMSRFLPRVALQGTSGIGLQRSPEGGRGRVPGLHPRRRSAACDQGGCSQGEPLVLRAPRSVGLGGPIFQRARFHRPSVSSWSLLIDFLAWS